MSKTYTLQVKAMAQRISGTVYDKVAAHYVTSGSYPIYVQFDQLPDALRALGPAQTALHVYITRQTSGNSWQYVEIADLNGTLDIENDVFPPVKSNAGTMDIVSDGWQTFGRFFGTQDLINGFVFSWHRYGVTIYTPLSDYQPYVVLTYNEGSLVTYTDEPGGYVDRTAANTFRWHTTWVGFPIENVPQTSATLQWKDGSSGTVNDISISGSATSSTMAANTLPASGELYWRVQAVTASGTATSEWRAMRTVDTPAVATPISPDSAYIDGTRTTRFVWDYQTASGTAPTGYDLQVKGPLDADFYTIKSETTSATYADIAAGTLPGGNLQWRVRAYNQSAVAGDWSAPLTCVVISAPNAPEVWIELATPRPTVSWSAVGQLGYQVRVEGQYDSGTRFGTEKTFKIPEYLAYNTFDALDGLLPYTSEETNGITYTWSNKMCTLTGTATATATNTQFARRNMPAYMHPGDVWYLKFVTNNPDIICSIWFYDSSNTTLERFYPRASTAITIPENAAKWRMYVYVGSGTSFADEPGVISDLRFLSSDSGQGANTPIEVRVLGEYDLWSPWGRANAQILSDGTIPLLLTGEAADGDASLSWDAVTGAEKYEILRFGKKIAETTATAYTDRYAVGSATYRVRACLVSDAYTLSNSVTLTLSVSSPRLTALDGDWIRLDKYTNPLPAVQITASRDVTLTQYAGVEYPVAEVGPHRTRLYVCNPAFSDHAQAAAFEQLLGRPVFVKDQYGNSLYGVMTSVQRSSQRFYTALTAMIQEIGGLDL